MMTQSEERDHHATSTSNPVSSPLCSLIAHCRQSLHGNNGLLSLRQLVPVHQTLCQVFTHFLEPNGRGDGYEGDDPDSLGPQEEAVVTSMDTILRIRCGSFVADQQVCRKILATKQSSEDDENSATSSQKRDDDDDPERLLVLQYLMFPLSLQQSLRLVLIPYLQLSSPHYSNTISNDLESALLDWMEIVPFPSSLGDLEVWQNILQALIVSPHPIASRILVKLVTRQPQQPLLIQALYDKLWETILAAMASPPAIWNSNTTTTFPNNHPLLFTLSKDLLPLLTKAPVVGVSSTGVIAPALTTEWHRPHIHQLWSRLIQELWYKNIDSGVSLDVKRVAMLVITTVLCPILPHLEHHHDLPLILEDGSLPSPVSSACPGQQPALWSLIYSCLSQGTSALEDESMTALSSILRRRGLFLLNIIATTSVWKQYVLCYETLEMESEQHLVDQIWEYLGDLFDKVSDDESKNSKEENSFGVLTWDWMSLLFGCVLSAGLPTVRKMGMHRILKAHQASIARASTAGVETTQTDTNEMKNKQQQRKRKNNAIKTKGVTSILDKMPPDFMLRIFLPSWNSLAKTVGYMMHLEMENRKLEREDMIPLMKQVLKSYIGGLNSSNASRAQAFWSGVWDWSLQKHFTARTFTLLFHSLAEELASATSPLEIPIGDGDLKSLTDMLPQFFAANSVVINLRREILEDVSIMLKHTRLIDDAKWNVITVLRLLSLFKKDYFDVDSDDWSLQQEPIFMNLKAWVAQIEQKNQLSIVSSTLASAFVDGQLGLSNNRAWDPEHGANSNEREMAWAILLLASLTAADSTRCTTSQLVWPAIHKGLSKTAGAILTGSSHNKADHVTRALLLLENGCLMRQLSGLGNGDLVVLDKTTEQLMPPPPNIESMLSSAVDFALFHIRTLLSIDANEGTNGARQTSVTYVSIVSHLRTLYQSYPSSQVISAAMESLIKSSSEALLQNGGGENDVHRVMHVTLIYAALSAGADVGREAYFSLSRSIVTLQLQGDTRDQSSTWEHMARSMLFYAKWASISVVLSLLGNIMSDPSTSQSYRKEARNFIEWLLGQAFDVVSAAALDAVVPVFNTILEAARLWIQSATDEDANMCGSLENEETLYVDTLEKIVTSLIDLMKEASLSFEGVYMLNRICSLIFLPRLMREEYERFRRDPIGARTPIRDAFRQLVEMAGSERAHISRSVLCQITVGWLGAGQGEREKSSLGLNAIPYRQDIVDLLVHKEVRKDEAASNQSRNQKTNGMEIPKGTSEQSLTRAFVLVFLEKLPNIEDGLNVTVLRELLEPVIVGLLVKAEPIRSTKPSLIMKGTPTYCIKMRAWQALCILSRFVTTSIVNQVCDVTYLCLQEVIHSQIRYFTEIFAVKCGMMYPDVFANAFLDQIVRTDLTLQQVASLMIIGGNWIVGKYKLDFFLADQNEQRGTTITSTTTSTSSTNNVRLRNVLAGAIPWLSSTQGFSRAIAQLLVYAVVPLVLDVSSRKKNEPSSLSAPSSSSSSYSIDNDGLLLLIYNFLDENREMARLRRKQIKFFEAYKVEDVCTAEGVLGIPVDEGEEADPAHLVEVMKQTLIDVYEETHGADAPDWKQMNAIMAEEAASHQESQGGGGEKESIEYGSTSKVANFQRKIMPLDALNLAMESQRETKLRNASGQRKQALVVCASLIDKIPNLAGLARTAEIFAADRLIVPDKSVCSKDEFQWISVGAGDWIDVEQVRPEALLGWLLEQKANGYFIVGLEQTASSISLDHMVFPHDQPSILLLGKEKEGIPVELLQAVDQCVEIPQWGIIRSLNVHVSGAIAIWEHTKQQRLQNNRDNNK